MHTLGRSPLASLAGAACHAASALVCVAVTLATVGCTTGQSKRPATSGDSVLKVGYLADLSGGSAALGAPGGNGARLATDEINVTGGVAGRRIELVTVDDKADPVTSAAAAQRLVAVNKVVAVLGGTTAGTVRASNAIITRAGVPQLITTAQDDTLLDIDAATFPMTFRVTEDDSYDVDAISTLLRDRGYQAICVLADSSGYGDGGLRSIQAVFRAKGLSVFASARHAVNAADLTAEAGLLRDKGCDAIYLYSLGQDGARFLRAINQIGWKVSVVGGRGLAAKSFLSLLGGAAADGMVIPGLVDPAKPGGRAFAEAYDRRYGADDDPAHVYSALGYDSMKLLAVALAATGGAGGTRLAAALETASLTDAAGGRSGSTLSFSTNRHQAPSRDFLVFYEVRGGTFRFLTSDFESGRSVRNGRSRPAISPSPATSVATATPSTA